MRKGRDNLDLIHVPVASKASQHCIRRYYQCNGWEFQKWPVVVHFWLINWEEKKTEMRKKIVKKSKNFDEKYITVVEKNKKISKTSQTNPKKKYQQIQKLSPTNPINITNKSKKITNKSSSFPSTKKNKFRKSNKFCPLNQKKSLSSSSSHCSYHSIIYIRARGGRGEC